MLWNHIKQCCPTHKHSFPNVLQSPDVEPITEMPAIAELMNQYFNSVQEKYVPIKQTKLDDKYTEAISNFVQERAGDCKFTIPNN